METNADISILFSDLDGTLLDDDKKISSYTIQVFQEIRKRNVRSYIATSRILRTSLPYAKELNCDGIIFCGGAGIMYSNGQFAYRTIPEQIFSALLNEAVCTFPDVRFSVVTPDAMYTNFPGENTIHITGDHWKSIKGPLRILFYNPAPELGAFLKKHWGYDCNILVLEGKNIIVTAKGVTKENALADVLNFYSISPRNAAYFGDDLSDLQCITRVGYGIATQNALDVLKKHARSVCKSNNDDGVAQWLSMHLIHD